MYVRDLMQREVATLNVSDYLDLADDIMNLGRIRHLPVLEGERLVGIVSQRDLLRAAISSVLQMKHPAQREWLAEVTVRAVMTPVVYTVGPAVSLRTAVALMRSRRIGCLPVVEGDKVVGLLSESDCLRHYERLLELGETSAGRGLLGFQPSDGRA